jgi:DNA-binding response OmpR family regulator
MKIFIIEDQKKIANAIKVGLEQEKYVVDVAYDGFDGYDLASSEKYDLIILDIMLPGMDGLSICKNLRNINVFTPIIMLTAKSELDDKVEGLNCGADDYLTKPFEFDELLARIKALLRRPRRTISETIECGDLKIDTNKKIVLRKKTKIELTKKEYELLEYLLRNKNLVLNKDQIISGVWSIEKDILPNTVEVYIGYLRNKIDKPFPKDIKMIRTIRGFGYKISEKND